MKTENNNNNNNNNNKSKSKNNYEVIFKLYELEWLVHHEIDYLSKLFKQECTVLEVGELKGQFETLKTMSKYIDEICEKLKELTKTTEQ